MRKAAALVLTVGLMASLAACSAPATTPDSTTAACTPTAAGKESAAIKVSGAVGSKPTVEIPTGLTATKTQRTVVTKGDGAVAAEGNDVKIDYTMYSLETGKEIDATAYDGKTPVTFPLDGTLIAGLTKTLQCSTAGSRVVGVMAASDGLTAVLTNYKLKATDSLVFVADVESTTKPPAVIAPLSKADGADQPLPASFPKLTVKLDDKGIPTVTLPKGDIPTKLSIATIKKGTGAVVPSGANVVVNYQGTSWDTGKVFDESYTKTAATFNTAQVIPGFTKALEGQTVGSQVVVVIPPAEAYGEKSKTNTSELAGQTLVFVIDILGIAK